MIQTNNISREHYINNIKPDYFITLPFIKGETIIEEKVTCFFCVETLPMTLKCVGIEYFNSVDSEVLKILHFGKYCPTHIYVFKDVQFNLTEERERLINY